MSPKEYLQRVQNAEREIRTIKAKIEHYQDLIVVGSSLNIGNTPVSHTKGSSRVETIAVGMIDALEGLNANLGAYEAIVRDAEEKIKRIPQANYRQILTLRYLCGWKFPRISEELRYTDRNSIYRAHGYALLELGKVMKDEDIKSGNQSV